MQEQTPVATSGASATPRLSRLAIAGFVLGLLALVTCAMGPLLGIPAVVLSQMALGRVKRSRGVLCGRGLARAGQVMGYAALAAYAALAIFVRMCSPKQDPVYACSGNVKQLSLGLLMYAQDYGGEYPPTVGLLRPYVGNDSRTFRCPAVLKRRHGDRCDYGYWGAGAKQTGLTSPAQTVLLADRPGNHPSVLVVGFADGHVESVTVTPGTSVERVAATRAWILPAAAHGSP